MVTSDIWALSAGRSRNAAGDLTQRLGMVVVCGMQLHSCGKNTFLFFLLPPVVSPKL